VVASVGGRLLGVLHVIRAVVCEDAARASVPWWSSVPFLVAHPRIEFTPGLNVVFGPNGSGKSTLLRAIARVLHCEQGGAPLVTATSVEALARRKTLTGPETLLDGLRVEHDGRVVGYFSADARPGVVGARFDDDFLVEGVRETMALTRASSGQAQLDRLARTMMRESAPIGRTIHEERVNDLWAARVRACDQMLVPTIEPGPATILLDEPERSLDLLVRPRMWKRVLAEARTKQILVATHDVFALYLGVDTNVIETQDGYASACRDVVASAVRGHT